MSAFYTTSDFFRDSYWLFDKFLTLCGKLKDSVKRGLKGLLDFEFESYFLRIFENLPYGILIFFLGFFLSVFLLRFTEGQNGLQIFRITTASMSPKILPGSLLLSYPSKVYEAGDVVSYNEKNLKTGVYTGRVLTHRIIAKRVEEGFYVYTLKGDNNENPDPQGVRSMDIQGKVFLVLPYMGYIDYLITTIPGFIIFIALPAFLLIKEARRYLH